MWDKIYFYITLTFLGLIFVSCVTNKTTRLLQERRDLPQYDSASCLDYKLKPNDAINLRVFSLNKEVTDLFNVGGTVSGRGFAYPVYADGSVDLPFADSIQVAGLTIEDARKKIEQVLKQKMEDIEVKIALDNNYFYMLGASGKGQYRIYKERLTVYQAIAMAGFSTGYGNLKNVKIIRQRENGTSDIVYFDLRTKSIIGSEYYYVYPNDIYYVESKGTFARFDSFTTMTGLFSSSISFFVLILQYLK
jgi:polysaccharide export outer membrane protein